jgi:thiamine-monophosphate kinase
MTGPRHIPLGKGGEFDAISAALHRWGALAEGVGDDCAVLEVPAGRRMVLSVDNAVENVHFRRPWLSPEEIGYRSAIAAISDLAAMAATPMGIAISLTLPETWRGDFLRLCDGIGDAARTTGARIIGGDLSRGTELALTISAVGHVSAPLARRGARPGDALWVTGRLGGPLLAVRAWDRGTAPQGDVRARFARPLARVAEAQWLLAHGATAGMDVSDGVVSEAGHLAAAGGVHVIVNLDRLPLVAGATPEDAARSGEEYELLVSAPAALDAAGFEAEFGLPLTCIGAIAPPMPGEPAVEALRRGERVELPRGHDHFPVT